jgi:hypothetical protein
MEGAASGAAAPPFTDPTSESRAVSSGVRRARLVVGRKYSPSGTSSDDLLSLAAAAAVEQAAWSWLWEGGGGTGIGHCVGGRPSGDLACDAVAPPSLLLLLRDCSPAVSEAAESLLVRLSTFPLAALS